jgi:hypothetical protein
MWYDHLQASDFGIETITVSLFDEVVRLAGGASAFLSWSLSRR